MRVHLKEEHAPWLLPPDHCMPDGGEAGAATAPEIDKKSMTINVAVDGDNCYCHLCGLQSVVGDMCTMCETQVLPTALPLVTHTKGK